MSKAKKGWLITAAVLTVLGTLLFAGAGAAVGFDTTKLSLVKPETNTYEITEDFDKISIDVSTAGVNILPAEDGICKVVCKESEKINHTASVEDGTLKIAVSDTRAWYERLSFFFSELNVTVYLPEKEYESVSVDVTTGNISISSLTARCSIDVKTSTGDILLKDVIVTGTLRTRSSTGNIKLDACDAGEISIKTSTGNVTGSLLSGKVFTASTSTGNVSVPDTNSGGKCEIKTSTGNVKIIISD